MAYTFPKSQASASKLSKSAVQAQLVGSFAGHFIGAMPVHEFLDTFLPEADGCPAASNEEFSPVENPRRKNQKPRSWVSPQGEDFFDMEPKPERATFGQFMESLQKFTDNFDLVETSSCPDPSVVIDGHEFQPDIALYNRGSTRKGVTDMSAMEAWITIKPSMQQDPFRDPMHGVLQEYHKFERSSDEEIPARAHMVACADAFFATQFRRFGFSILICGFLARFVRWDHAGAVVSQRFDYTDDGIPLAQFLWRLNCASPELRGVDVSVTPATLAESEDRSIRKLLGVCRSDPLYCYIVPDDNASHDKATDVKGPRFGTNHCYIGPRPTLQQCSLLDQRTRALNLWDPRQKKIVFFKESWRQDLTAARTESDIYRALHYHGIPHIPSFEHGGDMYGLGSETVTYSFYEAWWCCDRKAYHPFIQHRIILGDIGRPLNSFRSTYELVTAIRDAIEAHEYAYEFYDILHRNINTENIRITSDGRGLLMGWEFCTWVEKGIRPTCAGILDRETSDWIPQKDPLLDQTGTRRFMSTALLARETPKPHRLEDDMESFLYVLMYTVIRYLPSNMSVEERNTFLQLFDEEYETDALGRVVGGERKLDCFEDPDRHFPKSFKPHLMLDHQLRFLYKGLSVRYQERPSLNYFHASFVDACGRGRYDYAAEDLRWQILTGNHHLDDFYHSQRDKLLYHDWIMEDLDDTLKERQRWPEADAADHNLDMIYLASPSNVS
ncbi:hypothetical protein DFH29DRAFT_277633 [Suillus ampliporus]|nr:hypothetical protein DFH29DRAFT_277633 [Suillus ampliporus]